MKAVAAELNKAAKYYLLKIGQIRQAELELNQAVIAIDEGKWPRAKACLGQAVRWIHDAEE